MFDLFRIEWIALLFYEYSKPPLFYLPAVLPYSRPDEKNLLQLCYIWIILGEINSYFFTDTDDYDDVNDTINYYDNHSYFPFDKCRRHHWRQRYDNRSVYSIWSVQTARRQRWRQKSPFSSKHFMLLKLCILSKTIASLFDTWIYWL